MNHPRKLGNMELAFCDVLQGPAQLRALEPAAQANADLLRQVMEEAGKFVAQQLAPLQQVGDETS